MLKITYHGDDQATYEHLERLIEESGGYIADHEVWKGESMVLVDFKTSQGSEALKELIKSSTLKDLVHLPPSF